MSQTYRIGSLSFTGSQAILSASLDVSGSGRFTNGVAVTGSINQFNNGSSYINVTTGNTGGTNAAGISFFSGSTYYFPAYYPHKNEFIFQYTGPVDGGGSNTNYPIMLKGSNGNVSINSFDGITTATNVPSDVRLTVGSHTGSIDPLQVRTNLNSDIIRVKYDGRVGIGTSSPSASLDVSGSGRFTNGLTVIGSITASNGGINFGTGGHQRMEGSAGVGNWTFRNSSGQGWFFEWLQNAETAMILNNRNNLLVGTTQSGSGYRVEIGRNLLGSGSLKVDTTFYVTGSQVGVNNSLPQNTLDVSGSGRFTSNLVTSGSLVVAGGDFSVVTGSTNYLRIFPSTGNVFVGSTPVDGGFKLEVNGTVRTTGTLTTYNSSLTNIPVIIRGGNTDGSIYIGGSSMVGNSAARNVVIDPINTYSGIANILNTIVGRAGSLVTTGIANTIIGSIGGGSAVTTGGRNIFIGSSNGAEFSFTGSASQRIYISTAVDGVEGVSKAAPTGSSGWAFIGGYSNGLATNDFYFGASPFINHSYPATVSNLNFYTPSAIGTDFYGGNFILNAGRGTGTGSAGDVIFATSTTGSTGSTLQTLSNRVWIKGHTGFVGIGTATPSSSLDVSGSGRFTDGLTVTGSATITNVLTLPYQDPLPPSPATGSIALSGSGATFVGMFVWTGAWTQI